MKFNNRWTAFVRLKEKNSKYKIQKLIKYCIFELHESFKCADKKPKIYPHTIDNKKMAVSRPDEITLSYTTWGYFEMPITITFLPQLEIDPITIDHEICFENGGEWKTISISISEEKLKNIINL